MLGAGLDLHGSVASSPAFPNRPHRSPVAQPGVLLSVTSNAVVVPLACFTLSTMVPVQYSTVLYNMHLSSGRQRPLSQPDGWKAQVRGFGKGIHHIIPTDGAQSPLAGNAMGTRRWLACVDCFPLCPRPRPTPLSLSRDLSCCCTATPAPARHQHAPSSSSTQTGHQQQEQIARRKQGLAVGPTRVSLKPWIVLVLDRGQNGTLWTG